MYLFHLHHCLLLKSGYTYAIARHCMSDNREFLRKADDIKKKLSITLEPQYIRLTLLFDNKYSYLTFVPNFMYADDAVLTKEEYTDGMENYDLYDCIKVYASQKRLRHNLFEKND